MPYIIKKNSINEEDNKEKEIRNEAEKVVKPVLIENKESFKIKSYELIDKENHENKTIKKFSDYKNPPKVKALIPIPPKPKYSYLNKWLLRS